MKKILFILITIFIVSLVYKSINSYDVLIPNSSIRIRVIPNSNSTVDIKIKNKIKDYLENDVLPLMNNANTIEEARDIIDNNLNNIDMNINDILLENNYQKGYDINYGYNYFPKKTFHNKEYSEGYYDSSKEKNSHRYPGSAQAYR